MIQYMASGLDCQEGIVIELWLVVMEQLTHSYQRNYQFLVHISYISKHKIQ